METVSSSVIAGFILLFGVIQLIIYHKHSSQIDVRRLRPSFLYNLQISLLLMLPALAVARFVMRWKFYDGAPMIYGYMVSGNCAITIHRTYTFAFFSL